MLHWKVLQTYISHYFPQHTKYYVCYNIYLYIRDRKAERYCTNISRYSPCSTTTIILDWKVLQTYFSQYFPQQTKYYVCYNLYLYIRDRKAERYCTNISRYSPCSTTTIILDWKVLQTYFSHYFPQHTKYYICYNIYL